MSEKCPVCGSEVIKSGYNLICPNTQCGVELVNELLNDFEKDDFKDGYEKGVRDMFDVMQISCEERYKATCCKLVSVKFNDECTFETCPIAEKLLKGVK